MEYQHDVISGLKEIPQYCETDYDRGSITVEH